MDEESKKEWVVPGVRIVVGRDAQDCKVLLPDGTDLIPRGFVDRIEIEPMTGRTTGLLKATITLAHVELDVLTEATFQGPETAEVTEP